MSISEAQYRDMLARTQRSQVREADPPSVEPFTREIAELHGPIMAWCKAQHPQVPFIHTRPDQPSGMTKGAPDFVIVYRGKILLIECKTGTGKLSPDQRDWHHLAELQGVRPHVIRSMAEFYELVNKSEQHETTKLDQST